MLGNFLIGLREGLEAALVVSILVAYLVKSDRRSLLPRVWGGVALAVGISLAFGAALTFGPSDLSHETQELIGGILSVVAVGFVTWMVFWMAKAARHISGDLRTKIDAAADAGRWSLVMVALLAVGREGLETSLFLWAATNAAATDGVGATAPLLGAVLGIAVAVVLGYLFYVGAVRINLSKFFLWTGFALIVVAAGVLRYGVHDLQEAGVLPGEHNIAFDVSGVIEPSSFVGTLLRGLVNFSPTTSWLEAVAWLLYVVPVAVAFFLVTRQRSRPTEPTQPQPSAQAAA